MTDCDVEHGELNYCVISKRKRDISAIPYALMIIKSLNHSCLKSSLLELSKNCNSLENDNGMVTKKDCKIYLEESCWLFLNPFMPAV